jgi:hypothetical protein
MRRTRPFCYILVREDDGAYGGGPAYLRGI